MLSLLLVACGGGGGGGGGGGSGGGTSLPQTQPLTFPRSAPTAAVLNTPDGPGYAAAKQDFEDDPEYKPVDREVEVEVVTRTVAGPMTTTTTRSITERRLETIKASAAYARGATGDGEALIIVDSGIRDSHQEFRTTNFTPTLGDTGRPTDAQKSHGTAVASLAVGNRNGAGTHGVAFDADLHFIERPQLEEEGEGGHDPVQLTDARDAMVLDWISEAITDGRGSVANFSIGFNGAITEYDPDDVHRYMARTRTLLAQAGTDPANRKIIVWAAGNSHDRGVEAGSPTLLAGLGHYFPELQPHVLAVVALDQDGTTTPPIADYSNRCGVAKSFCLAAPGSRAFAASNNDDDLYWLSGIGTSFAAPLVSGSLILLRQYFRGQLGSTDLVDRLLATANRNGIYENSDIYGHGLLDLDAATAPVGAVMTGLPGDPASRAFAGTGIQLSGAAFGGALQQGLAGVQLAAFDELGAPFFHSATEQVQPTPRRAAATALDDTRQISLALAPRRAWPGNSPFATDSGGPNLSLAVEQDGAIRDSRLNLTNGWWLSYGHHAGRALGLYHEPFRHDPARFSDPLAFAAPWLSLVRHGPGAGWTRPTGAGGRFGFALMNGTPRYDDRQDPGGERGVGILLDYRLPSARAAALSLQAGAVREADAFLGARTLGAFGETQSATTFAGLNGAWRSGRWQLLASAFFGHTRARVDDNALLTETGDVLSSAFSVGAARTSTWRRGDWFGLRLSQPLRAESGHATLRLPTGRTPHGEVLHRDIKLDLDPGGRNLHAEAAYHLPLAGGALKTSLGVERHPQHNAAEGPQPFMAVSFERRF